MWKKDDEIMEFKVVSDPKNFNGKCQTVIWKCRGEEGYFVSVHSCDEQAPLTNLKWHPNKGSSKLPVEIRPLFFSRILTFLNGEADIAALALDVTTSDSEAFQKVWAKLLSRYAFIDEIPWSDKGMRFMVAIMLEAHYENRIEEKPAFVF